MKEKPGSRNCVAGINQFYKLVRRGKAARVLLASDADLQFERAVRAELADKPDIGLDVTRDSAQLAEMAGVEVPTAVLTFTK